MADAIPVHSEEPAKRSVKIKAPNVDKNGIQLPDDYVATVRENLGEPELFSGANARVSEVTRDIEMPTLVDGKAVMTVYTHRATKTEH